MTLCVIWKTQNKIHIASDSRISFGSTSFIDIGIKTVQIPVKIYSPSSENQTLDYDTKIGMSFAGSTINSFLIKEVIIEAFQNLQYAPPFTDISMDGICSLISRVYENISQEVCSIMGERGTAGFFVAGYCNSQKKVRAYKFELDCDSYPIKAKCKEILLSENENYDVIGSQKAVLKAKEFFANQTIIKPMTGLHVLNEIIKSGNDSSVGGIIQYGDFDEGNNFKIYGIQNSEIINGTRRYKLFFRGIDLDILLGNKANFVVSYAFICPNF